MARSKPKMADTTVVGTDYTGLSVLPAEVALAPALITEYVDNGFKASEVEGYERDIVAIHAGMAASVQGFVEVGERIASMKERTQHGSWAYLLMRSGLSQATAERAMAAYRAIQQYPALGERLTAFTPTTLAVIGQRKDMTPSAVEAITRLADAGEATTELVIDAVRNAAPAKEKKQKKHKTYFAAMPQDRAATYRTDAMTFFNQITGMVYNAGANLEGLAKSPDYQSYVKTIGKSGQTDLQRSLSGLLAACYVFDHPAPLADNV